MEFIFSSTSQSDIIFERASSNLPNLKPYWPLLSSMKRMLSGSHRTRKRAVLGMLTLYYLYLTQQKIGK